MADNQPQPAHGPLPNLEIMMERQADHEQRLVEVQQNVGELQQNVEELQQNVEGLQQRELELQQGHAGILEQLQRLRDDGSRQDKNSVARAINSTVPHRAGVLEPFYGLNGQLIPGFPGGAADIAGLNGDAIDALLVELGLGVTGTVPVRKAYFQKYIGFAAGLN
ncbi:hypothetical protein L873DRAFT_1848804 [Choiromyces venosus 120613-1]|uniref:Uncharacterized protein n=1 Tax=Choiromyces venosus 120613-1 TaxID=1336337 RepID=A0A3N4IX63_9PEZI|nr:hypothetical protein L873DRAFT_1848804 [Choiromyces venosus 120613-1]